MHISTLKWPVLAAAALLAAGLLTLRAPLYGAEEPLPVAPPALDNPRQPGAPQTAVLAGGCFWGVQGVFEHVRGVKKVVSGYAGGDRSTAQYETVSTGTTGHAESVKITFDPAQVSYGQLLQIAFSVVYDPTQVNRQGPDQGSQYRSAIFYADAAQQRIAESYVAQLNAAHAFPRPIATQVVPLRGFYPAEEYHQDYLFHHPDALYIEYNDLPKISDLERVFPALYSPQPVLTTSR
ncbi:MAG TPA: peptide-methionine (S)-S-oxide reductase MsrA [Steroidobacteraceae bacterium]|nr:peptide-methionine (S)-S-oxide reductase MsrA [Steroidobacteraceae bacterium]